MIKLTFFLFIYCIFHFDFIMAKQTKSSFTFDDTLSSVTDNNDKSENDHHLNQFFSLNDVVAIKKESCKCNFE